MGIGEFIWRVLFGPSLPPVPEKGIQNNPISIDVLDSSLEPKALEEVDELPAPDHTALLPPPEHAPRDIGDDEFAPGWAEEIETPRDLAEMLEPLPDYVDLPKPAIECDLQVRTALRVPSEEDQALIVSGVQVYALDDTNLTLIPVGTSLVGMSGRGSRSTFFCVELDVLLETNDVGIFGSLTELLDHERVDLSRWALSGFLHRYGKGRSSEHASVADHDPPGVLDNPVAERSRAKHRDRASEEPYGADRLSTLDPDQLKIAKAVLDNKLATILITGAAGTGKSFLVHAVNDRGSLLVAPTGLAAKNIGGMTIHRTFDIDIGVVDAKRLKAPRPTVVEVLARCTRVIIDEVSMVRADLIDAIDARLRQARKSDEPFGGVQIVMVGDPYQLPPIVKPQDAEVLAHLGYMTPYFFSAHSLQRCEPSHAELWTQHRQTEDDQFLRILSMMRKGEHRIADIALLNERFRAHDSVSPRAMFLCARNGDADRLNSTKLEKLPGSSEFFESSGYWPSKDPPAEETLELRHGAQVVFLRNDPSDRWVNGDRGIVVGWEDDHNRLRVELNEGSLVWVERATWENREPYVDVLTNEIEYRITGEFTQFPIRLSWAMSIHKSQGMTLPDIAIDLGTGSFSTGQTYVALSRVRSLSHLVLLSRIKNADIQVDMRITTYLQGLLMRE